MVVTAFAGVPSPPLSPVAIAFHRDCGQGDDAICQRRTEDHAAMRWLGATLEHLDFLDAVYRRRADGRWLCEEERAMFHQPCPEADLMATLTRVVASLCGRLRPDLVTTVAGVGRHVDHLATRDAVLACTASWHLPVRLWEDLPHVLEHHGDACVGRGFPGQWRQAVEQLDATAWDRKLDALACYPSQLRMLWPDGRDWRAELNAHAHTVGNGMTAERYWEPA